MRILVVEGSKASLAILTATLEALGHTVIGATSGKQGIKLFKATRPDLIIMDVNLPAEDGYECAKKLREINANDWLPIIYIGDMLDSRSILPGIDATGDSYLSKPLNSELLTARVNTMQHITEMQKKLSEVTDKLNIVSSTDVLTGTRNRLEFNKSIKTMVARAKHYGTELALILLDIDDLKEVNYHLGHHIGDLVLKEVAKRIETTLQEEAVFFARIGGDEFAIILDNIKSPEDTEHVAQKILVALSRAHHILGHNIHASCSIGIAHYPLSGADADLLIQNADVAMYRAKELGRNNIQHYTSENHTRNKDHYFMENALRFALDNDELFMCYQPIFNLRTQTLVGMEALMRWFNPTLGLVPPDIFIPIAEKKGLMAAIGTWSLKKVCEHASAWHKSGYKQLKLTVNLSSRQLLHMGLLKIISDVLKDTHFPPKLLEFELTESTIMSTSYSMEQIIKKISAMKVGISLDDFGTGFSSLAHLKKLPITTLKIDKSFIMDIANDPNDALIVKSIISLGKILNLNLIAEGIETEEQLQFLIKNKCDEGQGFYLSRPLTPEKMELLMQLEKKTSATPSLHSKNKAL